MSRESYELQEGGERDPLQRATEPWTAGTCGPVTRAALEGDPPALRSIPLLAKARRVPLPARRPGLQGASQQKPHPPRGSTRAWAGPSAMAVAHLSSRQTARMTRIRSRDARPRGRGAARVRGAGRRIRAGADGSSWWG